MKSVAYFRKSGRANNGTQNISIPTNILTITLPHQTHLLNAC